MLFYVVLNGFEYFMNLNNTNTLNICFRNLQKNDKYFLTICFPKYKNANWKTKKNCKKMLPKGIKIFLKKIKTKSVNMLVKGMKIFLKKKQKSRILSKTLQKSFWWQNKKYNCNRPLAFKSQRGYHVPKNYSINISIQKLSSIHIFTLKMQLILLSHELTSHGYFWPCLPKNHWINF